MRGVLVGAVWGGSVASEAGTSVTQVSPTASERSLRSGRKLTFPRSCWWPGPGSNRRPSAFQGYARRFRGVRQRPDLLFSWVDGATGRPGLLSGVTQNVTQGHLEAWA